MIDLKLVRLDDGALKATIVHEGEDQVFHRQFPTVDAACAELGRVLGLLPSQKWFRALEGE